MVLLGKRELQRQGTLLGRETFLAPVRWEKGTWPIVSPGVGQVQAVERYPDLPVYSPPAPCVRDEFEGKTLGHQWNCLGTRWEPFWSLEARPGWLRLTPRPHALSDDAVTPAFLGRRAEDFAYTVACKMEFEPAASGLGDRKTSNWRSTRLTIQ